MKGKIKWFNKTKGYGFIIPAEGPEAFFHQSGIATGFEPFEGCAVEFELGEGKKGPKAVNVRAAAQEA